MPRLSSVAKRASVSQSGSSGWAVAGSASISLAQRRYSGLPVTASRMKPSVTSNTSTGAEVWPRLPVGTRLTWATCCSISVPLVTAMAVASRAPVTIWPWPVWLRCISAAMVPKAQCSAVPKSTQLAAARVGLPGSPVMYIAPLIAWPMVSKPTFLLIGPTGP